MTYTTPDAIIPDSIMDKISKLLALSTSSNEHEAALAASRAQDLLLKYNLDRAEIEKRGHKASSLRKIIGRNVQLLHTKGSPNLGWERLLSAAVAKYNFCRVGYYAGFPMVYVMGESQNIDVVEYLLNYLEREIDRIVQNEYWGRKRRGLIPAGTRGQTWTSSFSQGCVVAIAARLEAAWREAQAKDNNVMGLIVLNDKALDEAYAAEVTGKGSVNMGQRADTSAYLAGHRAGQQIALNRGVAAGPANTTKQIGD